MEEKTICVKCDACGKIVTIPAHFKQQYTEEDWVYGAKICSNCQDERDLSCYLSIGNPVICLPDGLIFVEVRKMVVSREEVKEKLGSVCDVCTQWANCEKSAEHYAEGCEQFELDTNVECSVPCEQCYLYTLTLCRGAESKYIVTIDI